MTKPRVQLATGKRIDVGIDVHKKSYSVCILCEGAELYHALLPASPERLVALLHRFNAREVHTVYEAGPTGFSLHDALTAAGFDSMVTPPSMVPKTGGRVKTDRRDARKLATMLASGFLKRVHVLSPEERADRQLLRTRGQVERHRCQVMNQIKSLLLFHGITAPEGMRERWTPTHLAWLATVDCPYSTLRSSLDVLLSMYRFLDNQLHELEMQLLTLGQTERYRERVQVLDRLTSIGPMTAIALVLELQDVERFRRADQLASYIGMTPVQHSSGETARTGRITHCGNPHIRARLVQSAWCLIRFDPEARATFERIKSHTGSGKKAITAVARRLGLRVRRALLDMAPPVASAHGAKLASARTAAHGRATASPQLRARRVKHYTLKPRSSR